MIPPSYAVDSQSQAQDLASAVLTSSTPPKIVSTCVSIESFLNSHTPDQFRHFFSIAFPTLICKLFGFDDASSQSLQSPQSLPNGWIDSASLSNDSEVASKVFSLLAPNGTLMNAISAIDRHSLVKYVFPSERLPEWARFMLSSEKDCRVLSELCPLFKGKVKEDKIKGSLYQIRLSVFEYYMFWFAYYPVCRGNSERLDTVSIKRSKKSTLENWAYSIKGFSGSSKREIVQKAEGNLYMRLFFAYLHAFVPIFDLNMHQPYRSSILNHSLTCDSSVILRAEFMVDLFVHYWLVDNDFSPLPVNVFKSLGGSFRCRSVWCESQPTSALGELLKLFVKYLNLSSVAVTDGYESVEYSGSPRWRVSTSFDGGKSRDVVPVSPCTRSFVSWNSWIQRPLYRFILRTFLFSPVETSIKNASQVFSVWVSYMEPWNISLDNFSELGLITEGFDKSVRLESQSPGCGYSSFWQGYVLSNYLYYSSLVMHFIGFAHKFLHKDPALVVQMVLKVLSVLTSSKELIDLIKNVDTVFHSKQTVSSKLKPENLYRFVPLIREKLLDWEYGLCESDADGSYLHENWNKDLKIFSNGEDGGQQLLQLFILRAESELHAASGHHVNDLIDSLKAQVGCLFGGSSMKPIPISPELRQTAHFRDDIFKPRRAGNHAIGDIRYKGDWMKRPISSDEIAWLAKLLVQLSDWLNESLGLNQAGCRSSNADSKWPLVDVPVDVDNECGPAETIKAVCSAICSWIVMLGTMIVGLMRKHGVRVNLRLFASKKVATVLFVSLVFSLLKKASASLSS
ncbi:hypothetical protein SLE2022_226520 [Rubroshorea leprosula]